MADAKFLSSSSCSVWLGLDFEVYANARPSSFFKLVATVLDEYHTQRIDPSLLGTEYSLQTTLGKTIFTKIAEFVCNDIQDIDEQKIGLCTELLKIIQHLLMYIINHMHDPGFSLPVPFDELIESIQTFITNIYENTESAFPLEQICNDCIDSLTILTGS